MQIHHLAYGVLKQVQHDDSIEVVQKAVLPNLFRDPTRKVADMQIHHLAYGVLKQVQHDVVG